MMKAQTQTHINQKRRREKQKKMESWWAAAILGLIILLLMYILGRSRFYDHKMEIMKENNGDDHNDYDEKMKKKKSKSSRSRVPKGCSGWPFIGETLDFIASSYTSKPVTFMHKRKDM